MTDSVEVDMVSESSDDEAVSDIEDQVQNIRFNVTGASNRSDENSVDSNVYVEIDNVDSSESESEERMEEPEEAENELPETAGSPNDVEEISVINEVRVANSHDNNDSTVDVNNAIAPTALKSLPSDGNVKKTNEKVTADTSLSTDDDGQMCTICFDHWTNSGNHRLVSLKCGHLFGHSCIEKWLKGQGSKCPQCNCSAKKSDIRTIYARNLKAIDTSERDRALKQLEEESELRQRAQLEAVRVKVKYQSALNEIERLKKELINVREQICHLRSSKLPEKCIEGSQILNTPLELHKTINISKDGGCRVFAVSDILGMIVVSQPSAVTLFQGFGIKKISCMDMKPTEFVPIHQKSIRDIAFHSHDALVLTASLDRTLKLTSVISNSVVQTYTVDVDAWSCIWDKDDPCYFYAGLKNGTVLQFDTRMTSGHVIRLPSSGSFSPVVSLQYVQKETSGSWRAQGPLVGQLSTCSFYEKNNSNSFKTHILPLEGTFTSLSFESETHHLLVSMRPSTKCPKVTHLLCELSFETKNDLNEPEACSCNVVQCFEGGPTQVQITKSCLFLNPNNDTSVLACAADESSQAALIWDATNGKCHKLKADSPVLDIMNFRTNENTYLGTLTEKALRLYTWKFH